MTTLVVLSQSLTKSLIPGHVTFQSQHFVINTRMTLLINLFYVKIYMILLWVLHTFCFSRFPPISLHAFPGPVAYLDPETLNSYIATAEKIIHPDYNYANSSMKKVDDFIRSPREFFEQNRTSLNIPDVTTLDFSKTFVALAAPSLEGKTQTAFTLRSANVLYFVLAVTSIDEGVQDIYKPFTNLSKTLKTVAQTDLGRLGLRNIDTDNSPSAGDLASNHRETLLYLPGFLLNIMKQAHARRQQNFPVQEYPQLPNWMHFYANELMPFDTKPITIENFIAESAALGDNFCLFLDEFLVKPWAVYIRNFATAVGMSCVVSNTNTNITNLVSKRAGTSRSTGLNECWCIVFRRLGNFIVDERTVRALVEGIRRRSDTPDDTHFDDLLLDWLLTSRPGIAIWALEALEALSSALNDEGVSFTQTRGERNFGTFLQFVVTHVAKELSVRKDKMVFDLSGNVGKLGLLTHTAFTSTAHDATRKDGAVFNSSFFLRSHLYYVQNPTESALDFFLVFRPQANGKLLRVFKNNAFVAWSKQNTFFRSDELLTHLACLNIRLHRPTNLILKYAKAKLMAKDFDCSIVDLPNLSALKLSGNHLEVAVAFACMDASHHCSGLIPVYSLRGQDGLDWIHNIAANCTTTEEFSRIPIEIEAQVDFDLRSWLRSIRIPFLNRIKDQISIQIDRSLNELSTVPLLQQDDELSFPTGILATQYERTPDRTSIDGKFDFWELSNASNSFEPRICAIECKNFNRRGHAGDIEALLEKALRRTAPRLILIFTNQMGRPRQVSSLRQFCIDKRINLYRLRLDEEVDPEEIRVFFHLQRHSTAWQFFRNPEITCIIFEVQKM